MTDRLELDERTFWEECHHFEDWDYTFSLKKEAKHGFFAGAKAGYPSHVLDGGLRDAGVTKLRSEDWKVSDPAQHQRCYTNCCMFVESAILGAAFRSGHRTLRWSMNDHHTKAMRKEATDLPPEAYASVGLATLVQDPRSATLERGTIYVCQGPGHTFFIIDHGVDAAGVERVLILEANILEEYRQPPGDKRWGGVGFRDIGRIDAPRPPADWLARMKSKGTLWLGIREKLLSIAKLHVRPSRRPPAVHLPFDPLEAPSPWPRYYFLNEVHGEGGYFPLGLRRNLHGGVHLPYDPLALDADRDGDVSAEEAAAGGARAEPTSPLPVHALGPGEVVAARLGPPGEAGSSNALSVELAGNYNGFVLVRHRLQVEGEEAPLILFSLYLHLMPPARERALYENVPWLRGLRRRRHGALFELDPGSAGFGRRRWLAAEGAEGLVEGEARVAVWPDGPGATEPEPLELKSRQGRAAALRRGGEADVAQALRALRDDGKVATFATPFLTVGGGELVGYVGAVPPAERKGDDPAFLHWEVFAPVVGGGSALQRFLKAAGRALGLGEDHFRLVEEQTPNNVLDGDELPRLLAALPGSDGPEAGGPGKLLGPEYSQDDLRGLMRERASELAFALPLEGEERSPGLDYPLKVELETVAAGGKPTLAAGTQLALEVETDDGVARPVTLTLDAKGTASGTLHVPAGARVLRVKQPAQARLEARRALIDDEAQRRVAAQEVEHLRRLTGARWRRVLLRHGNEWSVEGLMASLRERGGEPEEKLRQRAESIAWWAHHEEPIVGAAGQEPSLFAPGADRLPADSHTKLDSVNPVTFAWLLDLLVARGKASFVESAELGGAEARQPRYLGWAPVERQRAAPRAVGGRLFAVAIARGEVSGGAPLALRARAGARTVPLGACAWSNGVATLPVNVPLWGAWTLEVEGDGPAPEPLGDPTMTFLAPVLEGGGRTATVAPPAARRDGRFEWRISFASGRPRTLRGWVFLETRRYRADSPDDGELKRQAVGIPFELRPEARAARKGGALSEKDGFYVAGAATTHVSKHFTYGEYCSASGAKECSVAVGLVDAVQAVRERVRTGLRLSALDPSGLSVTLAGAPPGKLQEAAAGLPGLSATPTADGKAVRLTFSPAPDTEAGGTLAGEFDPREALRRVLLDEALAPDERLDVRFGCLFLNGDGPEEGLGLEVTDWEQREADAGEERLRVVADAPSRTLAQPAFGPITATVDRGGHLVLGAPLLGADAAFWRRARPAFVLGEGKPTGAPDRLAGNVRAQLALAPHAGTTLTLRATCTGETVLDGVQVPVADAALEYDATPRVEDVKVTPVADGARQRVTARLHAWPPGKDVRVALLDANGVEFPLHDGDVTYDKALGKFGCNDRGDFGAELATTTILNRLGVTSGEARFSLKVYRSKRVSAVLEGLTEPAGWPSGRSDPPTCAAAAQEPVGGAP